MTSRHPMMQFIAYSAVVKMDSAAWGDEAGSTVTFRLPMQGMEGQRNPFERWTKRRKGHAGTRFYMAVSTSESQPKLIYQDEAMLAGWNDSQQKGHTVKLWLAADAMGHPFEGISREQELALALSELDDDNEPIDQKMRDRVEKQSIHPQSRLSYAAAMMCKNPDFWAWLSNDVVNIPDEEGARIWMCMFLGIQSRAELDDPHNHVAIDQFNDLRQKFVDRSDQFIAT